MPIFKENRTKFEIPISVEENEQEHNYKNKDKLDAHKKQKLIRELASNILDLNKLRSQNEKYESQMKLTKMDNRLRTVKLIIECEMVSYLFFYL